jgi:hypothetical protein
MTLDRVRLVAVTLGAALNPAAYQVILAHVAEDARLDVDEALAEFVGLLEEAARAGGAVAPDFWSQLAALGPPDVAAGTLDVGLAVFRGASGYDDGGRLGRIEDGTLTVRNYLASLLRAFLAQYAALVPRLSELGRLVLSGGLARRLPRLAGLLETATGYAVTPPTALDESLPGLRALALVASGRAPTAAAARARFGVDRIPASART